MSALSDKQFFFVAATGLGLGYLLLYSAKDAIISAGGAAGDAAKAVGTAINPVDRANVFSRAINEVVDVLDDGDRSNDSATLGTKIYDWLHPNEGF